VLIDVIDNINLYLFIYISLYKQERIFIKF